MYQPTSSGFTIESVCVHACACIHVHMFFDKKKPFLLCVCACTCIPEYTFLGKKSSSSCEDMISWRKEQKAIDPRGIFDILTLTNADFCLRFCRGIFRLLIKFQLDNQDNPSYTGIWYWWYWMWRSVPMVSRVPWEPCVSPSRAVAALWWLCLSRLAADFRVMVDTLLSRLLTGIGRRAHFPFESMHYWSYGCVSDSFIFFVYGQSYLSSPLAKMH